MTDTTTSPAAAHHAPREPRGLLVLRTLAMPRDANPSGDVFGGWLLSQMDIGAGLLAAEVAQGRVVTATVDHVVFARPLEVGDTVCVYAELMAVGHSSMDLRLEVWSRGLVRTYESGREFIASGRFRYVAVDNTKRPRMIKENPAFFTRN